MPIRRLSSFLLALVVCTGLPESTSAQSFGFGPRFSVVRDAPGASSATRMVGATIRLGSSRHVALEGAVDLRTDFSEDRTTRVRQRPIQASLLLFPVRAVISPYLIGGFGFYSEYTDTMGSTGVVVESTRTRESGWHLGGGAELFVVQHAALFVDYRFLFVRYGTADEDAKPIDVPGLDRLRLSHRGSMWTTGMAVYF